MKRLTTQEFIERDINKHDHLYDYTSVKYIKASSKVDIVCRIHGIFNQRPNDHLSGYGCLQCGQERAVKDRRMTVQQFVDRAQTIHYGEYGYSNVTHIINANSKVQINCTKHGSFYQTPDKHLGGTRCPKCSNLISRGEKRIMIHLDNLNIIYEIEKKFDGLIGTTKNSRLRYDFFIPSMDLLIEYDGEHHFSPTNIKGRLTKSQSINVHKATAINDVKKNNYAKDHKLNLIRIPYTKFNDIESIIDDYLKGPD